MMYCTKCGSDLKGAKNRCPACGYELKDMKMDLAKPRPVRPPEERKAISQPDQEHRVGLSFRKQPAPDEEGNEDGIRPASGCAVCGSPPSHRCFFTMTPLCDKHTVYMQIFVRGTPNGEKVPASPDAAASKGGRMPTQAEAKEAGVYSSVKPTHEWKRTN